MAKGESEWRFRAMLSVALMEFVLLMWLVLCRQKFRGHKFAVAIVPMVVVIAGMLIGKYGAMGGLPWWIYYLVAALITLVLRPVVFRLGPRRTVAITEGCRSTI